MPSSTREGGQWPKWYRDSSDDPNGNTQTYPTEQPHPSTNDYDVDWNDDTEPIGPAGLLIASIVWHGMKIDAELQPWQEERRASEHHEGTVPKSAATHPESSREIQEKR